MYECTAMGKLRLLNIKHTNPISVGDYVEFTKSKEQDNGEIMKIFPLSHYDPVIQIISDKLIRNI